MKLNPVDFAPLVGDGGVLHCCDGRETPRAVARYGRLGLTRKGRVVAKNPSYTQNLKQFLTCLLFGMMLRYPCLS